MKRKIEYRYTSYGSTYIRYNVVAVAEWDIEEQDFTFRSNCQLGCRSHLFPCLPQSVGRTGTPR
jgi:hypothetical protein